MKNLKAEKDLKRQDQIMGKTALYIAAITFAVLTAFPACIPRERDAAENGNFVVRVIADGMEAEIAGYTGTGTEIVIPDRIQGLPVTAIGDGAFRSGRFVNRFDTESRMHVSDWVPEHQITAVVIPYGVRRIEASAFFGNLLESVEIPDSVTHIGESAFSRNQLSSVDIPDGVTHIGEFAFSRNQLSSVDIPDGIIYIGSSAFFENQLTSVVIPEGMTFIPGWAFANNLLEYVVMPSTITHIRHGAFANNLLKHVEIPSGVREIYDRAFFGNQFSSIAIPGGMTRIRREAFAENQLTSVFIHDRVVEIGVGAFAGNRLTSVAIPDSVTHIERDAFTRNQIASVVMPNSKGFFHWQIFDSNVVEIWPQAFSERPDWQADPEEDFEVRIIDDGAAIEITGYLGINSVVHIPPQIQGLPVTRIGDLAFAGGHDGRQGIYRNLRGSEIAAVVIPDSVRHIGDWAFMFNLLTNIVIPDGVTHIGSGAFANNRLTTVSIPPTVFFIDTQAFTQNRMTEIEIPNRLAFISRRYGGHPFDPDVEITFGEYEVEYPPELMEPWMLR